VFNVLLHNPLDSGNYTAEWEDAVPSGGSIASVVHTVPDGLTKVSEGVDGTTSTVRISGGVHGRTYMVQAAATMSTGEVINRPLVLTVFNG
jgi:hypothetical protein